jgi:ADP-heptose:LPS heptosyltransferase
MSADLATFYSTTGHARKIIVVDLGFLGDTVHLVPALWEIKRNYAQAALHVLTSTVGADLLRLAPWVDRAWPLELARARRTLGAQWRTVRGLRAERFDVAFNFSGADRTVFMTAFTGARRRVAYPGGRHHFWNTWLIPEWAPAQGPDRLILEQRRQMLAQCGLRLAEPRFNLVIPPADADWAAAQVPEGALHVSVCSSKATREWPLEHHIAMFRLLWEQSPEICWVASAGPSPREQGRLRELAALTGDSRLILLPQDSTIPQLAAALARCRLHVGPDSGVLHLAVALNLPTVSFFRELGAFKSFMPAGPRHLVISMPCTCVDPRNSPCEKQGRGECFEKIEPRRVAALVRERLGTSS